MIRFKSKLPNPASIPYGLVMVNVWPEEAYPPERGVTYTGKRYQSGVDCWHRDRDYTDKLDLEKEYVWSFDGFRISDFQIGWFLNDAELDRLPESLQGALKILVDWWEELEK